MILFRTFLTGATALALAACSDQAATPADTASADGAASPAAMATPAAPPPTSPASTSSALERASDAAQVKAFPAALLGRWGLVPGDCTSQRGDTKGLAVITASEIRFYESVARIGRLTEADAAAIRGTFDYDGEGMQWSREMALKAAPDGRTMVLQEFGADAVPGPRTYTRCS